MRVFAGSMNKRFTCAWSVIVSQSTRDEKQREDHKGEACHDADAFACGSATAPCILSFPNESYELRLFFAASYYAVIFDICILACQVIKVFLPPKLRSGRNGNMSRVIIMVWYLDLSLNLQLAFCKKRLAVLGTLLGGCHSAVVCKTRQKHKHTHFTVE